MELEKSCKKNTDKMHKIIYTAEARENLAEIADYIGEYNLAHAIKFTQDIQHSIDSLLSAFPNSGEVYDKEKAVRKKTYKGYTAFYRVADGSVYILNVISLRKPLEARGIDFS